MLVAELDEVTYDLEVDGEVVRRTLHRKVIQSRGWATVLIAYEERGSGGAWKPAKLAMIRLQHVREAWKRHAAVTLTAADARALAAAVGGWFPPGDAESDDAE